jgi:hypothetical protein
VLVAAAPAAGEVALAPLPGGTAVLVWTDAAGVHARRVDRNGRLLGDEAIVLPCAPADGRIAVVPTPTGAAVVFGARDRVWIRRLGPDAQPSTDAARIWAKLARPPTAASVGGRIGMLGREDAGPVVETPDQGAIAVLVGQSAQEAPQILLTRYEGLPVLGPSLPWHAGAGDAALGARLGELAAASASIDGTFLTRVGLDGREIGTPIRLSAEGQETRGAAVAGAAGAFVAAWEEGEASRWAVVRVGRDGQASVASGAAGEGGALRSVIVAAAPNGFAVVGRTAGDVVVLRLDADGRPRGRPITVPGAGDVRPAALFVGQTLLVAIPAVDGSPRVVSIDAQGRVR